MSNCSWACWHRWTQFGGAGLPLFSTGTYIGRLTMPLASFLSEHRKHRKMASVLDWCWLLSIVYLGTSFSYRATAQASGSYWYQGRLLNRWILYLEGLTNCSRTQWYKIRAWIKVGGQTKTTDCWWLFCLLVFLIHTPQSLLVRT